MQRQSKIRIAFKAIQLAIFVFLLLPRLTNADDHESKTERIDFQSDIIPVLTKMGCNAGSCHGSAAGRGGFKLSLYGSQPDDDFRAIVQNDKGRRINRANHLKSLLLRKPGGEIDHGGDQRFDLTDPAAQLIANWIKQGVRNDRTNTLENFDVGPPSLQFKSITESHKFKFKATFSDNNTRDVTQWTVVTSNDVSSVEIDPDTNTASFKRPGRHIVIARFLDRVVPIEILIPFYAQTERYDSAKSQNFIDEFAIKKLSQLNIPIGKQSNDLTFLRRASLDLKGRLPTQEKR